MKKLLCIALSALMLFQIVAFADAADEISYSETAKTVYIAGDLTKAEITGGKYVTLLITDKTTGDIKYAKQITVDADRKYETKFRFNDDLANCNISIKAGDHNVEDSVSAAYTQQNILCSVALRDENGSHIIEPEELVSVVATIDNKHGYGSKYTVMVAFYEADGKLISCQTAGSGEYGFDDIEVIPDNLSAITVPEGTDHIQAFVWEDVNKVVPLTKKHVRTASDKKFSGDSEQIRVAFIGDSITYQTQYIKSVEHYYHTRYPDKDIVFINKGIGGHQAKDIISRFDWDIANAEIAGDIDEATVMLGMNDLLVVPMTGSLKDTYLTDESAQQTRLATYLENMETIIGLCNEAGISLTIITSSLHDETNVFEGGSTNTYYPGANAVLGAGMEALKALAAEYDIPVIDMWTSTTEITETVRNSGYTGEIITVTDRVHPSEQGGVYMAYLFAKQQDGNPIVASVDIDVDTLSVATENASVSLVDSSKTRVEYEYLAKAIPFAYSDHYQKFENEWNVPITEDINQEIIKVAGLSEGTYTITIGDNTLTKTYTAQELAQGVNIAIDENNPAQIQALQAFEIVKTKAKNEQSYRAIARTEYALKSKGLRKSDFRTDATEAELETLGTSTSTFANYFSSNPDKFGSKMYEAENWAKLRQLEQDARDVARPVERTVVIEKQ